MPAYTMRYPLLAVCIAGCASGGASQSVSDAPPGVTADAKEFRDGSTVDPLPDAHPDAAPDAHPDAHPIDAGAMLPDACVVQVTELLGNPAFDLNPMGS